MLNQSKLASIGAQAGESDILVPKAMRLSGSSLSGSKKAPSSFQKRMMMMKNKMSVGLSVCDQVSQENLEIQSNYDYRLRVIRESSNQLLTTFNYLSGKTFEDKYT
jgi:hypothetical protein